MSAKDNEIETIADSTQPFFYEIRVKGRLSPEQWTSWFDNLVVSYRKGESILRGQVPDHAALYGLLARLRDLTIPLQTVKVLDAKVQLKLDKRLQHANAWYTVLLITVYLLLLGGMTAFTVYLTGLIHRALALAILFGALGALAFALGVWSQKKYWRWVGGFMWPASLLTFIIYLAVDDLMAVPLAVGMLLFLLGGGLIYLLYTMRGRVDALSRAQLDWQQVNGVDRPETGEVASNRFQAPDLVDPDKSHPER